MKLKQQSSRISGPALPPPHPPESARFRCFQSALARKPEVSASSAAQEKSGVSNRRSNHPPRKEILDLRTGKTRLAENGFARLADPWRGPVGLLLHAGHPQGGPDCRQRAFARMRDTLEQPHRGQVRLPEQVVQPIYRSAGDIRLRQER